MAKTMTGIVASDKGNKTIVVKIVSRKAHPLYKKKYLVTKRIMAHDEANEAHTGDKVIIAETRPISANKHFILQKIVEQAAIEHVEDETVNASLQATEKAKPEEAKASKTKPSKAEVAE